MTATPFTRAFLLMFSGPLIWAAHFLAIYVFAALACARGFAREEWLGTGVVQWMTGLLTLAGVAAVAAIVLWRRRHGGNAGDFVSWTTLALGALSVVAMVWEALPATLLPACG